NLSIFTGTQSLNVNIASDVEIDEGFTFLSDPDHYILDFGKDKNHSRLSLYKDVSGYFNFRAFDHDALSYTISADISSWKSGSLHHIGASWKINTHNNRDEMHLFIDGLEVPNIIRYGQKLRPFLHEKFRTVDPEEIVGPSNRDIVASVDLHTTAGSNSVSSSINFGALNIFAGDTIFIDEVGFNPSGYLIVSISGQSLTLGSSMPLTFTDGRFSVNRTQFTITSEIDIASNIAVSTIHVFTSGSDLTAPGGFNVVSSVASNFTTLGVQPGYSIRIVGALLPLAITILQVNGHQLTLDDTTLTLSGSQFFIYSNQENEIPGVRALRPAYSISKDANFNNILTISNDVSANDLILIRTLGLNFRKVKKQYFIWGDGYENVLMTRMPPPISLDEANITKIILP
ncbi:MAG TPA: hypothetical protein VEP90_16430, partial [Methylomirabilota bacterium]|nr:hypothetical protein [Methylomirabilota bacterium]